MIPAAGSDRSPEERQSQAIPSSHRLKRRRLIRPLFDRRCPDVRSISAGSVRALHRFVDSSEVGLSTPVQIGLFVGRHGGGAVRRNRGRRRLREAYRRRHVDVVAALAGRRNTLTLGLVLRGDAEIGWDDLVHDVDAVVDRLLEELE